MSLVRHEIGRIFCKHVGSCKLHIIPCTQFNDPYGRQFGKHIGEHSAMISGLVFDHEFNSWLGSVKRMVLAELARKDDILVVCVCKRGRHRSVAAARILTHVFATCGVGEVSQFPRHLARKSWWNGICTDCESCAVGQVMNPEKRRSLAHAVLQWRQL